MKFFRKKIKLLINKFLRHFDFEIVKKSAFDETYKIHTNKKSHIDTYEQRVIGNYPILQLTLRRKFSTEVILYQYGCMFWDKKNKKGILWPNHEAGLFSCFSTILWTVLDIMRDEKKCHEINNTFSMNKYKEIKFQQTWYKLFNKKNKKQLK